MKDKDTLRKEILALVGEYYQAVHQPPPFEPGKSRVNYSGRFYDSTELTNLVDSSLDFWLTAGPWAQKLEDKLRRYYQARDFVLVNSGSSANLLMVATMCAKELNSLLREDDLNALEPGDEVITPAVTFPTTLAPLLQHQLLPVFIDCDINTLNINVDLIEEAISPKTRAMLIPHTLGNVLEMDRLLDIAKRRKLWLLEDGCDALGGTWDGKIAGSFGAMSSLSMYPAHHITIGEGGGVAVNHPRLQKTARSIRDWGRDCWCDPGVSNTCGKRFGWTCGQLPPGYDHKYIYSNIGYNLKVTDMQAAVGVAQMEKLPAVIEARRRNFQYLLEGVRNLGEHITFMQFSPRANPSPFGFPMTLAPKHDRKEFINYLEGNNIETRLVFGGNILRQPAFIDIPHRAPHALTNSDRVMTSSLFIGVYPRLTTPMLDYVIDKIQGYFKKL